MMNTLEIKRGAGVFPQLEDRIKNPLMVGKAAVAADRILSSLSEYSAVDQAEAVSKFSLSRLNEIELETPEDIAVAMCCAAVIHVKQQAAFVKCRLTASELVNACIKELSTRYQSNW